MGDISVKVQSYFRSKAALWKEAERRFSDRAGKVTAEAKPKLEATRSMIQRGIAKLDRAAHNGEWSTEVVSTALWPKKGFIQGKANGRVSRGEPLHVLDMQGPNSEAGFDWWLVRSRSGTQGWAHKEHLEPRLPMELSRAAGSPLTPEEHGVIFMAGRG